MGRSKNLPAERFQTVASEDDLNLPGVQFLSRPTRGPTGERDAELRGS